MSGDLHVIVVGQTPPPVHGQAVMIESLLEGTYRNVRLHHVRMEFARAMEEIGRFRWRKVAHLIGVIARIAALRIRWGASVLYYPPAGPQPLPVARDVIVLAMTRWMFRATILHFHAGGLSEIYPRLHPALRPVFRWAFFHPAAAVRLSPLAPDDPAAVSARLAVVVPYGIADVGRGPSRPPSGAGGSGDRTPVILYVGMLHESKGVLVLLEACRRLHRAGHTFRLELVGAYSSPGMRRKVESALLDEGLREAVSVRGVLTGAPKVAAYDRADVFCFPSFYEAEAFPVVLLEALRAGLPVVATRWRGIPGIVDDGQNGWLVPTADPQALSDRLGRLLSDTASARRMGDHGRDKFLAEYTVVQFRQRMQEVFDAVALGLAVPRRRRKFSPRRQGRWFDKPVT